MYTAYNRSHFHYRANLPGISSFVGKGSGLRTTEKKKSSTFGPADWKKSSSHLPSSYVAQFQFVIDKGRMNRTQKPPTNQNKNKENLLEGQFLFYFQAWALWYFAEKEHFQSHQKSVGHVSRNQSNPSPL